MKKKFLNDSVNIIKSSNPAISQEQLDVIVYGLEGLYLTWTKMIIIFGLAFVLGIAKEVLILLLCYNLIRVNAFGIHATKSIYCLITSLSLFVGGVYLCKYLVIPLGIKVTICLGCLICLFKYAPADTHKRPLVNSAKRKKFKLLSVITGGIFTTFIILFRSKTISNYLLIGMVEAILMIHPLVYKLFGLPFDNYKIYNCGV